MIDFVPNTRTDYCPNCDYPLRIEEGILLDTLGNPITICPGCLCKIYITEEGELEADK